jgi:hypothetical protein
MKGIAIFAAFLAIFCGSLLGSGIPPLLEESSEIPNRAQNKKFQVFRIRRNKMAKWN